MAWTPEKRKEAAAKGWALPDGSYPIADRQDVRDAVLAYGRTGANKAETKAHIIKRARELDSVDELPEKWGVPGSKNVAYQHDS
jgi:hypothetical protein